MRGSLLPLPAALTIVCVLAACGGGRKQEVAAALQAMVAGQPVDRAAAPVWPEVAKFYAAREYAPAWVSGDEPTKRAALALETIRRARDHGLAPADYQDAALTERHAALSKDEKDEKADASERVRVLADFDARLTAALLALGRDVALGREPRGSSRKPRREPPDLAGTLNASAGDPREWLDAVRPRHPEYASLQKALADLHAQSERGAPPPVPAAPFKSGAAHPAVAALRQRLVSSGDLPESTASSPQYDAEVERAVLAFQERHGLKPTGVADRDTIAALNVPLDARIKQVEVNLNRWRQLPDDLGARHFLVNIPEFHLYGRENGRVVIDMKVVVGTPENRTPVFSDEMETVVFSPYWNIPDTIVAGETAPAIARDPRYMARNQIEILRVGKDGTSKVDPSDVNWDDPEELKRLAFRQRPGAQNALGHVKFLFPNQFDVYLHDTPADDLFARTGRAFSHGCVRVAEPEALARYVLRDVPEWDDERIREAMHAGTEKHVKLPAVIPVHLVYLTAGVGPDGRLRFWRDIYGLD